MKKYVKKYDKEFREEAVRLALTSTQTTLETAKDLGISESTLYNWISKSRRKAGGNLQENKPEVNLVDELNRLRKENARLKEEREILKKAATFFANEKQ
jgi:transposase